MKTKFSFALTLVAVAALAASAVYCLRGLDRFVMTGAEVRVLNSEVRSLESAIDQAKRKQARVAEWKALLEEARRAGLRQDRWRTYPVSVSRELTWEELSTLVLIASNGRPRGDEYWFQPELLRVVRVMNTSGDANDRAQSGEGSPEMYRVRLKGDFLISTP
jgi:outer membrane murein-binding lipoprotein Lpp